MHAPAHPLSRSHAAAERLTRLARVAGTGFLFCVFGVGSLVLAWGIIPVAAWQAADSDSRALVAQRWIHRAFSLYLRFGTMLRMWEVEGRGVERLRDPGVLVLANHPTLLDVVLLLSFMPQADCVVKRAAWSNPILASIVSRAGYIPNDDGEGLIATCAARLTAGRSVVLFPEGSRSPEKGLHPFKRGAAQVALRAGCEIVTVRVSCNPPALKRGQPWYTLPPSRLHFGLSVEEPVRAETVVDVHAPRGVAARRLTAWLRERFEGEQTHAQT